MTHNYSSMTHNYPSRRRVKEEKKLGRNLEGK